MAPARALQDYDIYIRRDGTLDSLFDCPKKLKSLFALILSVQSLDWAYFGGTFIANRFVQATPVMQYESELKLEAEKLAEACLGYKRPDDLEESWVQILQSIVFYRFNTEAEEAYSRKRHHHCFICGKHFPLRSRPLLNRRSPRTFEDEVRRVHGKDKDAEDADVCTVHYNIPNFDIGKLSYLGYEDEKKKIPDLTIGLVIWADNLCYPPPDMDQFSLDKILQHGLVKAFRPSTLHNLEAGGDIKPIFAFPNGKRGVHVQREAKPSLNFPFALWEAKKASEGDPVLQNALKVKKVLAWQEDLATRANITWVPLMFHFVSMGSEWKLYACHFQESTTKGKPVCVFRLLWSGDCANRTKALQLLYLIDIVALWGQFQYKPFAAACIRTLKKRSKGRRDSCVNNAKLLSYQKEISPANFRSLQRHDQTTIALRKSTLRLLRAGTVTTEAEMERQIMLGIRSLSLKSYPIPEKDGFIWLQHRQLYDSDLLVVRVNVEGLVLPALVIFDSTHWESDDFRTIIREENVRMPQNIETEFRYDKDDISVMEKCFDATKGHCTMQDLQFCAILPLKSHKKERSGASNIPRDDGPLTQLLGLQKLVDAARSAYERYCSCDRPETNHMIQCDSTRCKIGWYHYECVGLDLNEDHSRHDWICATCKYSSEIRISKYDSKEFEDDVRQASDERIQRARSVSRAWRDHNWPDEKEVRKLYGKICCRIEMETDTKSFSDTVKCLEADRRNPMVQTRAILRDDPRKVTQLVQRFRASR